MELKDNNTKFTIDSEQIISSRFILGKLMSICIPIDSEASWKTVEARIKNLSGLDDDMYKQMAEIQARTKLEEEVMA